MLHSFNLIPVLAHRPNISTSSTRCFDRVTSLVDQDERGVETENMKTSDMKTGIQRHGLYQNNKIWFGYVLCFMQSRVPVLLADAATGLVPVIQQNRFVRPGSTLHANSCQEDGNVQSASSLSEAQICHTLLVFYVNARKRADGTAAIGHGPENPWYGRITAPRYLRQGCHRFCLLQSTDTSYGGSSLLGHRNGV